jgi:ectoine hydroxylase-related dioxygenase (phytanoyl-CoA dioxygenase family)
MITDAQIEFFRTNGYVAVENFFTPEEARAMQLEVARFKRTKLLNNVKTEGDSKTISQTKQNLQLCPMYDKSDIFKSLPFDPRVIAAVSKLIGTPFRLHLDQVFLKPARDGAGTSWHQDNAYFQLDDPMTGTAMWIAVHDASKANGTMELIPKRFNEKLEHKKDGDSNHHIRCYPDESEAKACELKAGGVVFFCYGTPHCTRGNSTDADRAGAAFHFLRSDLKKLGSYHDSFTDAQPGRPHLVGSKASSGVLEYGKDMRGTFSRDVKEILDAERVLKELVPSLV